MGIALAPDPAATDNPLNPKPKPVTPPVAPAGTPLPSGGALGLAPATPSTFAASAIPAIPAPTIAPPSAPVDRVKLATDTFDRVAQASEPAYAAAQRDTVHNAAALGQIASGGLRTKTGTLSLERQRDLDQLRQEQVTKATEGSIADATTAYQQALAGSQQGLAQTVGLGSLDIQKQSLGLEKENQALNASLAKAGLTGLLDGTETLAAKQQKLQEAVTNKQLSQADADLALRQLANTQQNTLATAQLGLARTGQAAAISQTQQQIDLAKQKQETEAALATAGLTGVLADGTQTLQAKQAAIQNAIDQGRLTNEQGQLALATLAQSQQNTLQTGQLALANLTQAQQNALQTAGLTGILADGTQTLQAKQAAIQNAIDQGRLTVEQGQLVLANLTQSQQNTLATSAQAAQGAQFGQTLELQRQQLAQAASQFGATQAQQLQLAQIADATARKQIDVSTTQGKNQLLTQLTDILSTPGHAVNPNLLRTVLAALGINYSDVVAGTGLTVGTGGATGGSFEPTYPGG